MNKRLAIIIFISAVAFGSFMWGGHTLFASSVGITGASGNPNNPLTCNTCHTGGIEPEVTLSGNPVIAPGELATFTLKISGGQQIGGGFNVSSEEGVLTALAGAMDVQALNDEVTHTSPKAVDGNGEAEFTFNWTAPMTPMTTTLYGAGNSVNINGGSDGDRANFVTLDVTVGVFSETIYFPLILQD